MESRITIQDISEIFQRANLNSICDFLQYGGECTGHSKKSYMEQLSESEKSVSDLLKQKFSDTAEYDQVLDKIADYATVCEDVYMRVGMQCGFAIVIQMLNGANRDGV